MSEPYLPGHEVIAGTIGSGKSFWELQKIVRSLEENKPLCFIDPKGDTYRNLLAFLAVSKKGKLLWEKNKHRILLFNPVSPSDYILGFNAIEPVGEFRMAKVDKVALLANSVTSHLTKQSGFEYNEAVRMQNIMSAAIGMLAQGGNGQLTLAELPYLYLPPHKQGKKEVAPTYNPFVEALLPRVTHLGTQTFWKLQWPTWTSNAQREWVQSTAGRIYPYLFDSRCLMTTCTTGGGLDFNRVVNERMWLFANIPYALLSEPVATLIGNLIITKIFYACMQRTPGSPDYRLILDEARFFNTGPLDRLLETSRAYGLWLTLVVQSPSQLCRSREGRVDESLKATALNNVRYWSIFHITQPEDAEDLSKLMFPLTGTNVRGFSGGGIDYQPVPVEEDVNVRRLMHLGGREMIFYDNANRYCTPPVSTPDLIIPAVEQTKLDYFEAAHLQLTGRPASEIMAEIMRRREWVEQMLGKGTSTPPSRGVPPAQFGGRNG